LCLIISQPPLLCLRTEEGTSNTEPTFDLLRGNSRTHGTRSYTGCFPRGGWSKRSPSIKQGAARVTEQRRAAETMSLWQQSNPVSPFPLSEHPEPPHCPHPAWFRGKPRPKRHRVKLGSERSNHRNAYRGVWPHAVPAETPQHGKKAYGKRDQKDAPSSRIRPVGSRRT